jgi:DNA replication protein DnaC
LLAIDELGYVHLDQRAAELLFQILTEREERASIAIASNSPFSKAHMFERTYVRWRRMSTGSPVRRGACRGRRDRRCS